MAYDRNELTSIGERFSPGQILKWSQEILQAARKDAARLRHRGISEPLLLDAANAREEVKRRVGAAKTRSVASPLSKFRKAAMAAAIDWREEIRGLARAIFDSDPDRLREYGDEGLRARAEVEARAPRSTPTGTPSGR